MKNLEGKRVLVTGAARGIGLELAIRFAQQGAELLLADRDVEALPEAVEAVRVLRVPAEGYAVDVTDPASIDAMRRESLERQGPVDVLINNAGVVFGGPFLEVPLERHITTYRVNVEGLVAMTHAFLPDLIERDEANLVNIASASGFVGLPNGSTYASSKWAVIGFSESIRLELERQERSRVTVTVVCPSYVGTGMFDGARPPATTQVLQPEFIADKVLDAVLHDRIHVLEPWLVKITPALKGLLPVRLWDMLAASLGANTSMEQWTGHQK